ncbi:MAG: DNA mismatch repair endonuclease MutL [Mucilaginibacter polytrichastri]|nr:DNA mismatch repair endonuclease MutL [Mucilaginibacter polytrichastri]
MTDVIQLLPDAVANQIAAGEVVQRPASAVKELVENALDAGAGKIQLLLKDAGKSLIQVIDDGCGMTLTDARMCFERHATSKIRRAEDLFAIRTMGFRGEAMASIAAIAQVELKTRRHEDDLGTCIQIEGSEVVMQEPCATPGGTSIAVKNLFYNTPARRNFLKSNPVEMRHIVDEFQRVALAHPEVFFTLHADGQEVYHLPPASLKQRIVHLFGSGYNQRLVPVEEDTSIIKLKGFAGKPEFARKTRGEQFFFVNKRFIRDAYLNHAVITAYEEVLPKDMFPLYVLFIDIDPAQIDINVHPTKTEIKYQDERSIYAIIRSAVKRALGQFHVTPSLDFDRETGFDRMITPKPLEEITPPKVSFNPDFNPFRPEKSSDREIPFLRDRERSDASFRQKGWESLYEIVQEKEQDEQAALPLHPGADVSVDDQPVKQPAGKNIFQLHQRYLISPIKSGFLLIDQQAAHERILYERFLARIEQHNGASQQMLFPQTLHLSGTDYVLLSELLPAMRALGFDVRDFGQHTVVIEGVPAELDKINAQHLLENLLEGYKNNQQNLKLDQRENLARTLARNAAIRPGAVLSPDEMSEMIDQLFACQLPNTALNGRQVLITITLDELARRFGK